MKDNDFGVLLEDIDDKLQRAAEGIATIHADIRQLKTTTSAIPEIQTNVRTIKSVVTDQSRELKDQSDQLNTLEHRLSALEAA